MYSSLSIIFGPLYKCEYHVNCMPNVFVGEVDDGMGTTYPEVIHNIATGFKYTSMDYLWALAYTLDVSIVCHLAIATRYGGEFVHGVTQWHYGPPPHLSGRIVNMALYRIGDEQHKSMHYDLLVPTLAFGPSVKSHPQVLAQISSLATNWGDGGLPNVQASEVKDYFEVYQPPLAPGKSILCSV